MRRRLVLPIVLAFTAVPAAAEAVVPYDVQVPLLLKALTYDRSLKARSGEQVRIAVLVPAKQSRSEVDELLSALTGLPDRTVNGMPVTFKEVQAENIDGLEQALKGGRWAAVYVMPGFAPAELAAIQRLCVQRQMLAVAATAGDVEKGMAFGVAAVGSRPQIVVHLPRAKQSGSDFDLALLRVAKVIQ